MAFKLLEKQALKKLALPTKTISISKSTIRLSSDLTKYFDGFGYVEVYLDRENNKVGLLPSNDRQKGFKISVEQGINMRKVRVGINFLRKNIAFGRYPISIDSDGLLVFPVREIAVNHDKD